MKALTFLFSLLILTILSPDLRAQSPEEIEQMWIELFQMGIGAYDNGDVETTLDYWKRSAEGGYAPAQAWYGISHLNGTIEPEDHHAAFEWVQKAADQGDPDGLYFMGAMYETGTEAVDLDMEEAVKFYRLAADQIHEEASRVMAYHHLKGEYLEKDPKKAWDWIYRPILAAPETYRLQLRINEPMFVLAEYDAENGHYESAALLLYNLYEGNSPEMELMIQNLMKSGEAGNGASYAVLGHMYWNGKVPEGADKEQAIQWWEKAAEHDDPSALAYLGSVYEERGDLEQSLDSRLRAVENGNPFVQGDLGRMYRDGLGTETDLDKSAKWLKGAVEMGEIELVDDLNNVNVSRLPSTGQVWDQVYTTNSYAHPEEEQFNRYVYDDGVVQFQYDQVPWVSALTRTEDPLGGAVVEGYLILCQGERYMKVGDYREVSPIGNISEGSHGMDLSNFRVNALNPLITVLIERYCQ